jgi:uncharacterized small protein (DUF1192 family)
MVKVKNTEATTQHQALTRSLDECNKTIIMITPEIERIEIEIKEPENKNVGGKIRKKRKSRKKL